MAYLPALCPKCDVLILVDEKTPFVECPDCTKPIASSDARTALENYCMTPTNTSEIIARCLEIEDKHGPELPRAIMAILAHNFPMHEQVHYLVVKFGNYQPKLVESYLSRFKNEPKKVPFAEDFLSRALTLNNMEFVDMFQTYIETKLPRARQERYFELIRELKESYVKIADSSPSMALLYTLFTIGGIINTGIVFLFLFLRMPIWAHVFIVFGILAVQMSLLFLHNRTFGNRLKISDRERLFMVLYMSSVVIAVGAVVIGWVFNI